MIGLRYLPNVTTLRLDADKCNGCTMCLQVCPHEVYAMAEDKAVIRDRDACMECGACVMNCPEGAISVRAGVGCAYAVMMGSLRGTEPTCDCGQSSSCDCSQTPSCC